MKKTLTINLNGTVFHIDEDAYEALSSYLDELTRQLASEDGSQEILEDIEARISELFAERLRYGMQVVRLYDVRDIIAVMGQPEQIADSSSVVNEANGAEGAAETVKAETVDAEAEGSQDASNMKAGPKRLLRAVDDRVIAGVCSGLGWYTGLDRWIFRALFITAFLLGYGFPLILYIILWIILPEARTLAQKLQMRGIAPTVENIRQAVNDGVISSNDAQDQSRSSVGVGGRLLMFVGGALLVLMAMVILPIAGFFGAMSMMDISMNSAFSPYGGTSYALTVSTLPLSFYLSVIVLIVIPIYALIHGLLWKADKAKPVSKVAAWCLGLLWLVALGVMSYQLWL